MFSVTGGVRRRGLVAGLLLSLISLPALAEKRVAMVIGNSAYVKTATLPNPKNDALAIADLLRKSGFDVVDVRTDLGVDATRRTLRDFSEQVRDADMAVVFYAGHGMELNGVNYLIPVDATLARDVDIEDEAISLDRVIRTIEPARRLQLVILDACRDNPFVRSMRRTFVSRSVRSGHADIDERALPPNTLIAYAQKAGLTAEDGDGVDSPYTTALLKHLATPGLDVELALRRVRDEVLKATRNRQEPFKYGSLGGAELPLVPAPATPSASSPIPTPTAQAGWSASEREWQQYGKDTKDISLLEAFKEKHKADPVYVRLAETRIEELKKQQVAIAAPPAPPTQQSNITISVAAQLQAEPGSRVRLPIEIRPSESVPKSSFVRIFGLPHGAALSEGHAVAPGDWAVPLTALPTLTIILPSGVQGQSDVAVSLVNTDGGLLADAGMRLVIAKQEAPAPRKKVVNKPVRAQEKKGETSKSGLCTTQTGGGFGPCTGRPGEKRYY